MDIQFLSYQNPYWPQSLLDNKQPMDNYNDYPIDVHLHYRSCMDRILHLHLYQSIVEYVHAQPWLENMPYHLEYFVVLNDTFL